MSKLRFSYFYAGIAALVLWFLLSLMSLNPLYAASLVIIASIVAGILLVRPASVFQTEAAIKTPSGLAIDLELTDYIGIALIACVLVALWQGFNPLEIIKILIAAKKQ